MANKLLFLPVVVAVAAIGAVAYIMTRPTTTPPTTTTTTTTTPGVVSPTVSVSPTSIAYGQTLTWKATGFTPNSFVQPEIHTLPSGGYDKLSTVATDANGSASGSVVLATNVSTGSQELIVVDGVTGKSAYATWTLTTAPVTAAPVVNPAITSITGRSSGTSTIPIGDIVDYVGTGFTPNGQVVVAVSGFTEVSEKADSTGEVVGSLQLSGVSVGTASLKLLDVVSSKSATKSFTVVAGANPQVNGASSVTVPNAYSYTGTGFSHSSTVRIIGLDGQGSQWFSTTTKADGSGNIAGSLPSSEFPPNSVRIQFFDTTGLEVELKPTVIGAQVIAGGHI